MNIDKILPTVALVVSIASLGICFHKSSRHITFLSNEKGIPTLVLAKHSNSEIKKILFGKKANVNLMTKSELSSVTDVSKNLAQRIDDYRKINGDFRNIAQLELVKGIGPKKVAALKRWLCVEKCG